MRRLIDEYPDARCELDHENPFQLLAATILSAQCTDARVNMVTPHLFARYPTAFDLAEAEPLELEEIIRSTGFFRSKAKSLIGMAQGLVEDHDGEVPSRMADLTRSCPASVARRRTWSAPWRWTCPGLPVDTHVGRLSRRLGLTEEEDPVKVETVLNAMIPAAERGRFSLRLILHGRRVCPARRPRCGDCVLNDFCPSSEV